MHTGRPVGEHGLYEWNVYEPALGRGRDAAAVLVRGRRRARHAARLRPRPGRVPRRRHAVPAPGGRRRAVDRAAAGLVLAVDLRRRGRPPARGCSRTRRLAEGVDGAVRRAARAAATRTCTGTGSTRWATMHGPESPRVRRRRDRRPRRARARPARGARARCCWSPPTTGRSRSTPRASTTSTSCGAACRRSCATRPAGSSRDVFLHTRPRRDRGGRRRARGASRRPRRGATRSPTSWPPACSATSAPRLRARLADVCVLPAPGRTAWLRSAAGAPQRSAATTAACTPTRSTPGSARSSWLLVDDEHRRRPQPHDARPGSSGRRPPRRRA